MQIELEIEIRRIAKENDLPEEVVTHIFNSQWKFLQQSITKDNTKTVMLPKFAKFCLSKRKLKHILIHNERNNKEISI
jgi:nucleoid DNA-binding protein